MKRVLLALAAVSLAGCGMQVSSQAIKRAPDQSVEIAQNAVRDAMKDPESARFKDTYQAYTLSNGDLVICGEVNGKNSFGGYVGYSQYYVRLRNQSVAHIVAADAEQPCNLARTNRLTVRN